jgi:hypothetical protein
MVVETKWEAMKSHYAFARGGYSIAMSVYAQKSTHP